MRFWKLGDDGGLGGLVLVVVVVLILEGDGEGGDACTSRGLMEV